LAEHIHHYIRNVGGLHLRKPNPGAPGGERVIIEVDGTYNDLVPSGDDVQERWIDIADIPGQDDGQRVELELPPPYEVPNPHPGEELLRRLRKLTQNGSYRLVFRRVNDFSARWEAVLTDQLDGLDDDLFNYEFSCYGSLPWQSFGRRTTESYLISDDDRRDDREGVAYHLGIRCTIEALANMGDLQSLPAAKAAGNCQPSQSEKAKLRRRVKEFLGEQAEIEPPRAQTKADWRHLVRQEFGDAVTDNLFDAVWRQADLPPAWRAPGRRT
jgi:hypothetical protein